MPIILFCFSVSVIQCPTLSEVVYGDLEYNTTNSTTLLMYGTVVTYSCHEGFVLVGVDKRSCQENGDNAIGQWTDADPVCSRKLQS